MVKQNIGAAFNVCPMPVVMVGTVTDGKPNFMTAAWVVKLQSSPPIVGVSLGRGQHTAKGIVQTGEFSLSFPSVDQVVLADYCGLVHGYEEDKAAHIEIFTGSLASAPMVGQCPVSIECRLKQKVELDKDYFFIADVVNVYAEESVLSGKTVDWTKVRPFVLTMPGNTYWALGENLGPAWGIGKSMLRQNS